MRENTKIGFIGAGRVGTSLGKYLSNNGYNIIGYYSKSQTSALKSAEFISDECAAFENIKNLADASDIIFITTNDGSIKYVCNELCCLDKECLCGKTFCHTSGSLSSDILNPLYALGGKTASLHMLLAVSDKFKSYSDFEKAFFTLEGCGSQEILEIVKACGNQCRIIESQYKAKYHAAAVFTSNFVVALSHIGCSLLTECGFSYNDAVSALAPLIELNVQNIINQGPENALTGPIERGDFETVRKHLDSFSDTETDAVAKDVYKSLSRALMRQTGRDKEYKEKL